MQQDKTPSEFQRGHKVDILIVGGGLVGLSLALAFKGTPWRVKLLDQQVLTAADSSDTRTLALSWSSLEILKSLLSPGAWERLQGWLSPIEHLHISEAGTGSLLRLHAKTYQEKTFGAVVPILPLYHLLQEEVRASDIETGFGETVTALEANEGNVTLASGASLKAQWILACDGGLSQIRDRFLGLPTDHFEYDQSALVTSVSLEEPHQHWAFERFLPDSILALLPLPQNRAGVVWVQSTEKTKASMGTSDEELLRALQSAFGQRLGKFFTLGPRHTYPLMKKMARSIYQGRVLLMGNAAHHLNPVGAQGWNLALRDIFLLRALWQKASKGDFREKDVETLAREIFEPYVEARAADGLEIEQVTHAMAIFYGASDFLSKTIRRGVMTGLRWSPLLQEKFVLSMMGKSAYFKMQEVVDAL